MRGLTVHRRVHFILCMIIGYCASVQVSMQVQKVSFSRPVGTWSNLKKELSVKIERRECESSG